MNLPTSLWFISINTFPSEILNWCVGVTEEMVTSITHVLYILCPRIYTLAPFDLGQEKTPLQFESEHKTVIISAETCHLWHQRGWNIVDNIRFDPVGFRSLIEGQATSSATLVSISQWPIVPVKHKKKIDLGVIMIITFIFCFMIFFPFLLTNYITWVSCFLCVCGCYFLKWYNYQELVIGQIYALYSNLKPANVISVMCTLLPDNDNALHLMLGVVI